MKITDVTIRLIDAWPVEYRMPDKEPTHYRLELHARVNGYSRETVSCEIPRSDLRSKLDIVVDSLKRDLVKRILQADNTFFTKEVDNLPPL